MPDLAEQVYYSANELKKPYLEKQKPINRI